MRKKIFIIIVFVILFIPVCLNWIISTNTPWNISIAGNMKEWIGFYGSYTGGIVAATISFIILIKTLKHNRNENFIDRKRQDIKELKHTLSERYSYLNFTRIRNIAFLLDSYQEQNELLLLDTYYQELETYRHSFEIVYEDSKEEYIIDFIDKYNKCIISLCNDIRVISEYIISLPEKISNSENEILDKRNKELYLKIKLETISITEENEHIDIKKKLESIPIRYQKINKIEQYIMEIDSHQKIFLPPVLSAAKKWIETEIKILNATEINHYYI